MSLLNIITDPTFITAIGGLFGTISAYFIAKANNKKETTQSDMADRMQLSKDQYSLIAELRDMLTEQREQIESLSSEVRTLQDVNINLTFENKELQSKISNLSLENKELQIKINELNARLDKNIKMNKKSNNK